MCGIKALSNDVSTELTNIFFTVMLKIGETAPLRAFLWLFTT